MTLISDFEIKVFEAILLTGAYQFFDKTLSRPTYAAVIVNESTASVYISVDGTTDSFRVGAGKTLYLNGIPRHRTLTKGEYLLKKGTQLYIKHNIGPGTGTIVFHALMTI